MLFLFFFWGGPGGLREEALLKIELPSPQEGRLPKGCLGSPKGFHQGILQDLPLKRSFAVDFDSDVRRKLHLKEGGGEVLKTNNTQIKEMRKKSEVCAGVNIYKP